MSQWAASGCSAAGPSTELVLRKDVIDQLHPGFWADWRAEQSDAAVIVIMAHLRELWSSQEVQAQKRDPLSANFVAATYRDALAYGEAGACQAVMRDARHKLSSHMRWQVKNISYDSWPLHKYGALQRATRDTFYSCEQLWQQLRNQEVGSGAPIELPSSCGAIAPITPGADDTEAPRPDEQLNLSQVVFWWISQGDPDAPEHFKTLQWALVHCGEVKCAYSC